MTQYGFNDNDIMDEVIICDIIHATSMGNFESEWNRPWYESSPHSTLYDEEYEIESY